MNENGQTETTPDRILLATDLSARCDRALDRAAQLADEWQAELIALNVLDPAVSPDQALAWACGADEEDLLRVARQQLRRDLAGLSIRATMRTARAGDAAEIIRDVAAEIGAGLVVTGMARDETLGRFLLGSIVERLARMLSQPLLVVHTRPRAPYRRIVVATDFSESSRHALQAAARLFPERELILYHAYEIPLSTRPDEARADRIRRDIEQGECADFVTASELPAQTRVRPAIEHGSVAASLTRYVREHDIDVVVAGTRGRSAVVGVLLGSTAATLLEWLPCDTLLVRQPRPTM